MRQHSCPRCGTTISYWAYQRDKSWWLQQIAGPISCHGCGAVLRWSIGRWEKLHTAILMLGAGFFAWLFFSGIPRDQRLWMIFAFCLGAGAVRIVLELLATRLIDLCDDGD